MARRTRFGRKIRSLRMKEKLTQAALAERMEISASYLNLIEHDRRPLSADLLIRLATIFSLDLGSLSVGEETRLEAALREVFGDPLFDDRPVPEEDIRDMVAASPEGARAVLHLFHAYNGAHDSAEALTEKLLDDGDLPDIERSRLSPEEVSDFLQSNNNYFPELEEQAEMVWREAQLTGEDLFAGLPLYLEKRHGVTVRVLKLDEMGGAVRRFDPRKKELLISELLRRGSRNFQIAYQIGLLRCPEVLERLTGASRLTSAESRVLARVALANYFAAAVLMPYREFLADAEEVRYDLDLLGHRFRVSAEQVCHRLTSLHRPGAEGVPFHMVRVDLAGNISKRFNSGGIHFPRFSGLCPLWNVHAAFLQPGRIRVQVSRMADGTRFFSISRTILKHRGGYHAREVHYAIGLGCDLDSARQLVYADGVDLAHPETAVPVGITCRLCELMDCKARAFPPLQIPIRVDENVRGVSFYAPIETD